MLSGMLLLYIPLANQLVWVKKCKIFYDIFFIDTPWL